MSNPILLTGATGFIGRAFVRRFLAGGGGPADLRCLVRDVDRAVRHGLPRESLIAGSLDPGERLDEVVRGSGAVVHLAGLTRALSAAELFRVNAAGAGHLAAAAARHAPGARFVHVSSLAAAGPTVDGVGTDAAPDACRPCSRYGESKLGGERAMLTYSSALDWCVLRPPIVYGPGDDGTRLLFRQALAPVAVVPWRPRPLSWIHVDDVADALVAALTRRGVQGFFPLEGPDRTDTDRLVHAIARACGRAPRVLRIPMWVPRAIAPVFDLVAKLRRSPSFLGTDKLREAAAVGWVADARAAERELGFVPTVAATEGLAATARAEGLVRVVG